VAQRAERKRARTDSGTPTAVAPSGPGTAQGPSERRGWLWGAGAALAAAIAFAGALGGDFVYDDLRQIVANPLIQTPGRVGEALASDVWAFMSTTDAPGSNYWRPAFVAWMVLNHRLFGLDPGGWHLANLLLHALVTALAFGFLRQLRLDARVAASVALLFAVHPVHVESVAWVAGSPDLLLSAGALSCLWMVLSALERPAWWKWALAGAGAVVAVGSKEVGVVLPALVFGAVALAPAREAAAPVRRLRRAALVALPFAALASAYFVVRLAVIEGFSQDAPWQHGMVEALLTAPTVIAFYLRQTFLPFTLGPVYPLRPLGPGDLDAGSFFAPLAVVVAALVAAWWMARRGAVQAIGLALFVLTLLPALNIAALPPERLVQDRYLYLPLLGALMMVVPTATALLARGRSMERAARLTIIGAGATAALLLVQTVRYTAVWMREDTLWARAVETDPGSASSWAQHASQLRRAGRAGEAESALDRSIGIAPMPPAMIERADLRLAAGRTAEAEADLRAVRASQPSNPLPYERLAVIEQGRGNLAEAERLLRAGRAAAPAQACGFSANLGVVLFLQGRRQEAAVELQRAAALADRDISPVCRTGVYYLGALRAAAGDSAGAREAWTRYLSLTEGFADAASVRLRAEARRSAAAP